jgi:hypothetical protein
VLSALHPDDAPEFHKRPRQGFHRFPVGAFPMAMIAVVMSADLLARRRASAHACSMFSVDEATAAAIRQAFENSGELSAVVELRRHFPGIRDNAAARLCVRTIASWKPLPPLPPKRTRVCRTRSSTG